MNMKYAILVPDGAAGLPLDELSGRTCMEVAHTPNMDVLAKKGIVGLTKNVPDNMTPASDVANLSILGYDPNKYYCGRGPFEAANLGVEIKAQDVAFRFNTVTVTDGKMSDYSAGHITTQEVKMLVETLNENFANEKYHFYTGTSYRNLLKVRLENPDQAKKLAKLKCWPPHDITAQAIKKYLPKNNELVDLMERSKGLLEDHEINNVRIALKQNPANMIWLWGQGTKPDIPSLLEAYGLTGGMISAVDLLKGMGRILGMEVVEVEGATGYYDTNYDGKAQAAIDVLSRKDLVFVHLEAPDEAGHNGDLREKVKALENFDRKIVRPVVDHLEEQGEYRILILPDHPTPISKRTHTRGAVPFLMAGKNILPDDVTVFSEISAKAGSVNIANGFKIMKLLLERE